MRIAKNLTQKDLSKMVGINQAYVSKIERGKIEGLTIKTLLKIAECLEVSPFRLLCELLKIKNGGG